MKQDFVNNSPLLWPLKENKLALKARDTESTSVFTAIDEPQARELINTESFNRL